MSVGLYMDVHVRRAITEGLRLRGVDVLTAQAVNVGRCIADLEVIAKATDPGDWINHLEYLPLR